MRYRPIQSIQRKKPLFIPLSHVRRLEQMRLIRESNREDRQRVEEAITIIRRMAFPKIKQKVKKAWEKHGKKKRVSLFEAKQIGKEIKWKHLGDILLALKELGITIMGKTIRKRNKKTNR